MSYNQYPDRGSVNLPMNEVSHKLDFDVTSHAAPPKIEAWLLTLGWTYSVQDPTNYEQLFQKAGEDATEHMYYRWYEAVAYESFKFMTLADGQNE